MAAYRDCMRLLISYTHERHGVRPAELDFAHLDDGTVAGFLDMLEHKRHASVATRNARLAAVHSLFSYSSFRHPEHAELIARVLAIPSKATSRSGVVYLDDAEVDAFLAAPDRQSWSGQRDHAWLLLMITTGIRVGELVNLRRSDLCAGRPAHIVVTGKGRKQRIIPVEKTTATTLASWTRANPAPPRRAPLCRPRSRRPNEQRRRRSTSRAPRQPGRQPRSELERQDRHPSHAQAHLRDEDAGQRIGHHHHRFVARSLFWGGEPVAWCLRDERLSGVAVTPFAYCAPRA